jgi:maltoporin
MTMTDEGHIRSWKRFLAGAAVLAASAPGVAAAGDFVDYPTCSWGKCGYDLSENFAVVNYARVGIGYIPGSGQMGRGLYMNLGDDRAIGGRLEEGDYLLYLNVIHLYKPSTTKDTDLKTDLVFGFDAFGNPFSEGWGGDRPAITFSPADAYVITHNVLNTPGLTMWVGSRLYRFQDVHLADYFYFNDNPGIGGGVAYQGLEVALLEHTGESPFFKGEALPPAGTAMGTPVQRGLTQLTAQYKLPLGKNNVQFLGEFHFVPAMSTGTETNTKAAPLPDNIHPADIGYAAGAKLHLDLNNGQFNDTSLRIGGGIANGAASGRRTWETFGLSALDGSYNGAFGLEFVDHFLFNFGSVLSLNGYGMLHYDQGARNYTPVATAPGVGPTVDASQGDGRLDFAVGARATYYVTDQFHLNAEPSFQIRQDSKVCSNTVGAMVVCNQTKDMGMATKLALFASVVPTGKAGPYAYWGRPEMRAVYILGLYNQAAQNQLMSPYLQANGASSTAHYVGLQMEWWIGF